MLRNRWLWFIVVWVLIVVGLVLSGCTVHFKASEVELDSVATQSYDLQKVDLFGG